MTKSTTDSESAAALEANPFFPRKVDVLRPGQQPADPEIEPHFTVGNGVYGWRWPKRRLEIQIDRVIEKRDGFNARITVWSEQPTHGGLLHQSRYTLDSEHSKVLVVNKLKRRVPSPDYAWTQIIENVSYLALEHHSNGNPAVDTTAIDYTQFRPHLLYPFISGSGGSVLFADGGSCKTNLAQMMALSIVTGLPLLGDVPLVQGPVMYADWEDDEYVFAMRARAITRGANIALPEGLLYQKMSASLLQSHEALARKIEEAGVVFVVIDSLSAACGGGIEKSEDIGQFFDAARNLGVPYLVITHVTNEGAEAQAKGGQEFARPHGSRFISNRARLVWGIEVSDDEYSGERHLLLTCHKNSYGPKPPYQSYGIQFYSEGPLTTEITLQRTNAEDVPSLFGRLPLSKRITLKLEGRGISSTDKIAELVDAKREAVESRLHQMRREGRVVWRNGMWRLRTGNDSEWDAEEDDDQDAVPEAQQTVMPLDGEIEVEEE